MTATHIETIAHDIIDICSMTELRAKSNRAKAQQITDRLRDANSPDEEDITILVGMLESLQEQLENFSKLALDVESTINEIKASR